MNAPLDYALKTQSPNLICCSCLITHFNLFYQVHAMEARGFRAALIDAVEAGTRRSHAMGENYE